MAGIEIVGTGRMLPSKIVTNDMMSEIVDTSDEWITSRTGIKQRYFCDKDENVLMLAKNAAQQAIADAGIDKEDIGFCLVASFTPEFQSPSVACLLQSDLGLSNDIMALDFNAACSGFVYGMQLAAALLSQKKDKYVLLVGAEHISKILDFSDRATCILFGDGAGAVLLKYSEDNCFHGVSGSAGDPDALCSTFSDDGSYKLGMDGQGVFRFAVDTVPKTINAVLEQAEMSIDDIDYVICHQANKRIIDSAARRLSNAAGRDVSDKFYINVDKYANTSAASIPIAIDEMKENGLLKKGMNILLVGFGSGLTWGSVVLKF